jgi:hypothetical protein
MEMYIMNSIQLVLGAIKGSKTTNMDYDQAWNLRGVVVDERTLDLRMNPSVNLRS